MLHHTLLQKYDVPSPRYTSYPTVPYWDEAGFDLTLWKTTVTEAFRKNNSSKGISIYIHLPFCEQLCTYCGCNKRITTNHGVENTYIDCLLKEWKMYLSLFPEKPLICEIHLGGGTPTFFSPENLARLISEIQSSATLKADFQGSFEVHPNFTRKEHLQTLFNFGFRRVSIGIQDFDPKVQYLINRIQSFERTKEVFEQARKIGYTSVNADIIYGLPGQTQESIQLTIFHLKQLKPDRIAFYSYAHVPWKSKSQRRYSEADLPAAEIKRGLYEYGRNILLEEGYDELGMDHFVLPEDDLALARQSNKLQRNFMGYTVQHSELLIGLGVSSIGDTWNSFAQNIKEVEEYEKTVNEGNFPILKGHLLNNEDIYLRRHILNLICNFEISITQTDQRNPDFQEILRRLKTLQDDGLVTISSEKIAVTELGKPFIRNICLCFDARLWRKAPVTKLFSQSI